MKKTGIFILGVVGIAGVVCGAVTVDAGKAFADPWAAKGTWYRTNLHAHTTLSDGDVNLAVRVKMYKDAGYQVLAITDHEKTNDVQQFCTDNFLLISGMETHPRLAGGAYHFVFLNVPRSMKFDANIPAAARINALKAAGGEYIYAHPYWLGHTIRELESVDGYIAMEVYNGVCMGPGKGVSSVLWDELLGEGKRVAGVAVDDIHSREHLAKGWVMIKAEHLAQPDVMNALRSGCYYASCGPIIEEFRVDNDSAIIKCSGAKEIRFMGQSSYGQRIVAEKGKLLRDAHYKLQNGIRYVRVEVVDGNDACAWTNPIFFK